MSSVIFPILLASWLALFAVIVFVARMKKVSDWFGEAGAKRATGLAMCLTLILPTIGLWLMAATSMWVALLAGLASVGAISVIILNRDSKGLDSASKVFAFMSLATFVGIPIGQLGFSIAYFCYH